MLEGSSSSDQNLRFNEKVVIVTGSSSGIGRQTAIDFVKMGASVVIHGQNTERLQKVEDELCELVKDAKVLKVYGSLEDDATIKKLIEETITVFGKIDVLVNNAGIVTKPETEFFSIENLDYLYKVNLRGPVFLTQLAIPHLKKTRGNIINIGTIGAVRLYPFLGFYGVIKTALDHQTRLDATLNGPEVRVNSVLVGPIETPVLQRHGLQDLNDYAVKISALKRIGQPEDISNAILFLACNDLASYVTGASLIVDGGCVQNVQPLDN